MNQPATVPVTVTPEAAAHVAELGLQREFEQMLEHLRQTVPDLLSIHVVLAEPCDAGETPRVIFEATHAGPYTAENAIWTEFSEWKLSTFPPEVFSHFQLFVEGGPHGR